MSADDVLPRRPAQDVELQHGYTLYQVNALSIWAVQRDTWHSFVSFDQRLEVTWHAMIEHIYSSAEPPEMKRRPQSRMACDTPRLQQAQAVSRHSHS